MVLIFSGLNFQTPLGKIIWKKDDFGQNSLYCAKVSINIKTLCRILYTQTLSAYTLFVNCWSFHSPNIHIQKRTDIGKSALLYMYVCVFVMCQKVKNKKIRQTDG